MGFKVKGNVAPEAANPVPVMDAALTVTAEPPVEDRTTVSDAGTCVITSPKLMLVVLRLRKADVEVSCSVRLWAAPPALAVSIAAWGEFTGETLAIKFALVAPAATVTELGTFTNELLLERATTKPPLAAAAFKVAVQLSVPDPVNERLAQVSPLNTGTPVPLRPTTVDVPPAELLVTETWPLAVPASVGSNCTLSDTVWPGVSVTGRPPPEIVKFAPVIDAALTVTATVPIEESTSDSVTVE